MVAILLLVGSHRISRFAGRLHKTENRQKTQDSLRAVSEKVKIGYDNYFKV